jgi:DNA-binding NarL/FixJ family response regulator
MAAELAIDKGDENRARTLVRELRDLADEAFAFHEVVPMVDHLEAALRLRLRDFTRAAALAARGTVGWTRDFVQIHVLAQSRPDIALSRLRALRVQGTLDSLTLEISLADVQRRLKNMKDAEAAIERAFTIAANASVVSALAYAPIELGPLILQVAAKRGDAFSDRVTRVVEERTAGRPIRKNSGKVTEREIAIMRMLAAGLSQEQVADHLHISTDTVKSHSGHVARKVGVRTRAEAIELLRDQGIL